MARQEGRAEWQGLGGVSRGLDSPTVDVVYQSERDGVVYVRPAVPRREAETVMHRLERAGLAWVRLALPGRGVVADWWEVWVERVGTDGEHRWQRLAASSEAEAWDWKDTAHDCGAAIALVRGPGQTGPALR